MITASRLMEKVLFKFAGQWIAGDTYADALLSAKQANEKGMRCIVNMLGEYHTSRNLINNTTENYKNILSSFKKEGIKGSISVKPTQIGLYLSRKACSENLEKIVKHAYHNNYFLWIDMESSEHTTKTIQIYHRFFSRHERLGIALQANLKRTHDDLTDLLAVGAKIRLVKGAYREKAKIAFKSIKDVDSNYFKLMKMLFKEGNEFGIATHDCNLINEAKKLSKVHDKKFEFQFLKGVRDDLKPKLLKEGFKVSEYIPYGTNWLPYSIRRLKERKRNILLLGHSFIRSHLV